MFPWSLFPAIPDNRTLTPLRTPVVSPLHPFCSKNFDRCLVFTQSLLRFPTRSRSVGRFVDERLIRQFFSVHSFFALTRVLPPLSIEANLGGFRSSLSRPRAGFRCYRLLIVTDCVLFSLLASVEPPKPSVVRLSSLVSFQRMPINRIFGFSSFSGSDVNFICRPRWWIRALTARSLTVPWIYNRSEREVPSYRGVWFRLFVD